MFKSVSIKFKLLVFLVIAFVLLSFSISYLAINKSSQALLDAKFEQLLTIEVAKKGEVEKYFDTVKYLLSSLQGNRATKKSFNEFKKGFETLDKELGLDMEEVKK